MAERIDFSRNASVYDRRHGEFVSPHIVRQLIDAAHLRPGARMLDLGAGTGRAAIPFVLEGYRVVAMDVACGMLASMRQKAGDLPVPLVIGDGTQLPFATASFDVAMVARLVYLVPGWLRMVAEIRRVLAPGAPLLHEWGNGDGDEDWVQVRDQARALFEAAGVSQPFHPGARTEAEVDACLAQYGLRLVAQIPCDPAAPVTMREFLARIESGECSYTWKLSGPLQEHCVGTLLEWARARFDLDRPIASRTVWKVFSSSVA